MSQTKLLLRNITSLGLVQIVNYVFPLLTIPFVSRILGPSGLGLINYTTAFVAYFTLIVGYGFDLTATRRIASNSNSNRNVSVVFSQVTIARFCLFSLSTFIFIICIFYIQKLNENLVLCLVIYINVISILIAPQYIYQGIQKITIYSYVNILRGIISTLFIFFLIRQPKDFIIYASIGVLINFFSNLFLLLYAYQKFKLKFYFFSLKSSINLIYNERFIFFSSVIFSLYTSTNIVILGFYDSPDKVGYYTVALGLINIIQSVINIPLSTSLYPFLGNSFSQSIELGISQVKKILPIVFYITFVGGIIILSLSPFLIRLIYGSKFDNAIPSIMILSFLPLISSISSILGVQTMLNLKMDKEFVKITFNAAIISIFLNLILGYFYSYIGTSVSYLVTEMFILVSLYSFLSKKNIRVFDLKLFSFRSVLKNITSISK